MVEIREDIDLIMKKLGLVIHEDVIFTNHPLFFECYEGKYDFGYKKL